MSEIENKTNVNEEDEISLLDLFSVLIRHRIMIIAGTIAAFIIGTAYLFIIPKFNSEADQHEVTIEYSFQITSLPLALEQELGLEDQKIVLKLSEYNLNRLRFVADEIQEFKPFGDSIDEMTPYEYNRFIQNLVTKNKYAAKASPLGTEITITLQVPEVNISIADKMVNDMVQKTSAAIEEFIFPKLNAVEKNVNESLKYVTDTTLSTSLQKSKDTQILIQNFRASYSGFLHLNGEPFILLEPLGRLKKLIIIVFAVFFILVFVAFLLNAVDNIKQDPEASDKIKTAWDGGKIGKKK